MRWLIRAAVPLVLAGLSVRRSLTLRGPMLWLALVRGVGFRGAIPVIVLLSLARRLARPRRREPAGHTATGAPDGRRRTA